MILVDSGYMAVSRIQYIRLLLLSILSFNLYGCSVYMAATSPDQPNQAKLQPAVHKKEIERELGRPIKEIRKGYGTVVTYQYFGPDEVSTPRAVTYAVVDFFTLGFAELVTTPIETLQNDKHTVTVIYDSDGFVESIQESTHKAPLEKPEKILGIEKANSPQET